MNGVRKGLAAIVAALSVTMAAGTAVGATGGVPPVAQRPAEAGSYVNPVSRSFADTFADPSVIRGKDGWWYSYGTSDPLREGEKTPHLLPTSRSRDLVRWSYVGDAFTTATRPTWATANSGIWAPDIRYVDGQWRLYYTVTDTTLNDGDDSAIGMATAPSPTGPWTDSGAPVVAPRPAPGGGFLWTFDPSVVTDRDGSQWIFFGSYFGGIHVAPLDASGRRTTGAARQVAIDNKFEGAYVVRHGGWWYLFASTANCCAGPTTGYSVQVGRSRDLRGPYLDRQGTPLTTSRAGGTPTLVQNGNAWIGAGHNAIATDVSGQDWIVYHAIDRADPYLDGTDGINERPMLLDRLDWIDGWPQVDAGRGPSGQARPSPVTVGTERLVTSGAGAVSRGAVGPTVRVEADVRGRAALVAGAGGRPGTVRAVVSGRTLRLSAPRAGRGTVTRSATLPATFAAQQWHAVSLEVRRGRAVAQLSHARLGDPLATVSVPLPTGAGSGRAGALRLGRAADVTNVSVSTLARQPGAVARERVPDRPLPSASDEFDGGALGAGWSWVRPDPAATVAGGVLRWPTEAADLTGTGNDAGILLREAPRGSWTATTKVSIDLGVDVVRNFQQAGLIVYATDDLFTRLSHVAIWNTRQTEFGKEMPYAGRLSYGGTIVGPPAETTWLRVTHRSAGGEHVLRAWTSRDGRHWVEGGVWTLPGTADLRVGLVSHGGAGATAQFDWFRLYR